MGGEWCGKILTFWCLCLEHSLYLFLFFWGGGLLALRLFRPEFSLFFLFVDGDIFYFLVVSSVRNDSLSDLTEFFFSLSYCRTIESTAHLPSASIFFRTNGRSFMTTTYRVDVLFHSATHETWVQCCPALKSIQSGQRNTKVHIRNNGYVCVLQMRVIRFPILRPFATGTT